MLKANRESVVHFQVGPHMTKYFSYGHDGHEMVTMTVVVTIIIHRDHSGHYFQDTNSKKILSKELSYHNCNDQGSDRTNRRVDLILRGSEKMTHPSLV